MANHTLPDRVSGIYAIVHVASGRHYVGSAQDMRRRFHAHRHMLTKGNHHSIKLQRAWQKYGSEAFSWVVLETVPDLTMILTREQHWMDHHKAVSQGFNVHPDASGPRGHKLSVEVRAAFSAARKGRPHGPQSAEHRANTSAAAKLRKYSIETRAAMSAARKGRRLPPLSAEHRAKIAAAKKGSKMSPEARAKMSAVRTGKPRSGVALANLRAALIERNKTPKMRAITIERNRSPEMRAVTAARNRSPDMIAVVSRPKAPEHAANLKAMLTARNKSDWMRAIVRRPKSKQEGEK